MKKKTLKELEAIRASLMAQPPQSDSLKPGHKLVWVYGPEVAKLKVV